PSPSNPSAAGGGSCTPPPTSAMVCAMAGFQIKVRNLETGEALVATLDSYQDALTFLGDRPPMMEIITVISDVSPVQMRELKEAMRPYDDDEKKHLAVRSAQTAEAVRRARESEEA